MAREFYLKNPTPPGAEFIQEGNRAPVAKATQECRLKTSSTFAGSFEVTVASVSLPPFVSRRGLSNTNQRLSLLNPPFSHCTQPRLCRIAVILSKTHRSLLPPPFVSNRGFWSKNHHFSLKYKPSATPSFSPPPLLFSVFFVRSACACCPEVTVTSSSLRLCRLAVFFSGRAHQLDINPRVYGGRRLCYGWSDPDMKAANPGGLGRAQVVRAPVLKQACIFDNGHRNL